jgi:hypothetical protein
MKQETDNPETLYKKTNTIFSNKPRNLNPIEVIPAHYIELRQLVAMKSIEEVKQAAISWQAWGQAAHVLGIETGKMDILELWTAMRERGF